MNTLSGKDGNDREIDTATSSSAQNTALSNLLSINLLTGNVSSSSNLFNYQQGSKINTIPQQNASTLNGLCDYYRKMSLLSASANSASAFMLNVAQYYQRIVNYIASQQTTSANLPAMGEYLSVLSQTQSGNSAISSLMLPCNSNSQELLPTQRTITRNVLSSNKTQKKTKKNVTSRTKYQCDVCGKYFTQSGTLIAHKRIHTGEKPYKCDVCDKSFRQSGNLARHKPIHNSIKKFICQICDRGFNRTSNLYSHLRTHTRYRISAHRCLQCGQSFRYKTNLNKHVCEDLPTQSSSSS